MLLLLLQASLFEAERTVERDVVSWLKQDIEDNAVVGGGDDDRVAAAALGVVAKLPIKSSLHQPA